mgnify:CR=1 FL=1
MFSEAAQIALVAARLGQFQTRVILIPNFTRPMRLPILVKQTQQGAFHQISLRSELKKRGGAEFL